MKNPKDGTEYYFVDEAGDTTFYDRKGRFIVGEEGCSNILLLGFINTKKPKKIRAELEKLRKEVINDPYLESIPSLEKTKKLFHAKDDAPEVREKVFKLLVDLDFETEMVVARKNEKIFQERYKGKESLFYDDLIIKLFQNKLHLAKENKIYFAVRGSKKRQEPLDDAIQTAVNTFESENNTNVNCQNEVIPQSPSGELCLQVVDYVNWALQRAFQKGDDRYYKFISEKVRFVWDVYDSDSHPKNYYDKKKNPFDINKISPL